MAVTRKSVSNAALLNAIIDATPQLSNVPRAIEGSQVSVEQAYMAIKSSTGTYNAFFDGIKYVIGDVLIAKLNGIDNPLEKFVRDGNFYGNSFYELAMDILPLRGFDNTADNKEVLRVLQANPTKMTEVLHIINFEKYVTVSISDVMVRRSIMKEGGLAELIDKQYRNVERSMTYWERQAMKKVFTDAFKFAGIKLKHLDADPVSSKEAAEKLIYMLRKTYLDFQNPSRDFTLQGYMNSTPGEDIQLLVSTGVKAYIDTYVNSNAYNLDYVKFLGNVTVMEEFDALGIDAFMFDTDFPMFMRTFRGTYDQFNPLKLYNNIWLHSQMSLSASPFMNAVAFTHNTIYDEAVTAVTVSTEQEANAKPGNKIKMTATVTGDSTNAVYWNVVGFTDNGAYEPSEDIKDNGGTHINDDGMLVIGAKEAVGNVITVEAYAQKNNTKVGTKEITILQA